MKSDLDIKDAKAMIELIVPLVDKLEDYINDLREISEAAENPEGWNDADDPPELNHLSWVGCDGEFVELLSSDPVQADVVGFDTQPAIYFRTKRDFGWRSVNGNKIEVFSWRCYPGLKTKTKSESIRESVRKAKQEGPKK